MAGVVGVVIVGAGATVVVAAAVAVAGGWWFIWLRIVIALFERFLVAQTNVFGAVLDLIETGNALASSCVNVTNGTGDAILHETRQIFDEGFEGTVDVYKKGESSIYGNLNSIQFGSTGEISKPSRIRLIVRKHNNTKHDRQ